MKGKHLFYAHVQHRDAEGRLLWEGDELPNLLHDQGEEAILSAYFDTDLSGFGAPPANLYVGLRQNSPAEGDTLASGVTEEGGAGYARQAVSTATGHTLSQVGGDWQAASGTVTFTNSGGSAWGADTNLFVCTVVSGTSGKLLCSIALSTTRTLQPGDSVTVSYSCKLSE